MRIYDIRFWLVMFCLGLVIGSTMAAYMKMDPPPDVDKAFLSGNNSCWLATATNMLAGAGYGNGKSVQERAEDIYDDLTAHFGTASSGWADTALTWWLTSPHNTWPRNPYTVVTVYGNKSRTPWTNTNGARFVGNELRRCQMLGLSISWPRMTADGGPSGGHAITCWGDSGGQELLAGAPAQVIVTDSDRETGGDIQNYTYDSYTSPNPGGYNEGNGWYINFNNNHPFIKHIVTLCPTDTPGDHMLTQKVTGSYRIHQQVPFLQATDLHYKVGTDVDILSYRTWLDWATDEPPIIEEDSTPPRVLTVDWDLKKNPVPYCTWVTITTEFVVPYWNGISYQDVHFTYPEPGFVIHLPDFHWQIITPEILEAPSQISNVSGGYVVGSFDLIDATTDKGLTIVGEYRFMHEYDFMQDPESHLFQMKSGENESFLVGNLRFGHSYGMLDLEGLWAFNDWITRIPEQYPIRQLPDIELNWKDRLPYPQGEIYQGEYKPPQCSVYFPEDINQDCCVDIEDFALLARRWLQCTTLER